MLTPTRRRLAIILLQNVTMRSRIKHLKARLERAKLAPRGVTWVPLGKDHDDWSVTGEILEERHTQRAKGYTAEHDDMEGWQHLLVEARSRIIHAGHYTTRNPEARESFITAAALLVAAVEVLDRAEADRG